MERTDFNAIVLASLLHDVGKLLHRGRSLAFDIQGKHQEVSARFIKAFSRFFSGHTDVSLLGTLVLHHHRTAEGLRPKDLPDPHQRLLALLVNKADGLSASERGQRSEDPQDDKTTPLAPVFLRVSLPEKTAPKPGRRYYPVSLATPDKMAQDRLFPAVFEGYQKGDLEALLHQFGEASGPVLQSAPAMSFNAVVFYLLNLLQAYACRVPADTQEQVPDVSLFDHLKSTAAIAACLSCYLEANGTLDEDSLEQLTGEPFLLVVGDLSGIQSYIFDIASGDSEGRGVARRLRARSLFIQLVCEVAAHDILTRLDLPPTNLLMASGGRFYLLLPNTEDTLRTLVEARQRADRWCLEVMRGEIALNLAWYAFGEADLKPDPEGQRGFGQVLRNTGELLAARKEQRLASAVVSGARWAENAFVFRPFGAGEGDCPSCHKFPRPQGQDLCSRCKRDHELGARLPRARFIAVGPAAPSGFDILGYAVSIGEREGEVPTDAPLVLAVNQPASPPIGYLPTSFRYILNRVPVRDDAEGAILTWNQLAQKSQGRPYLGFLKADADRLGQVFGFGLKGWDTISRLATLSRELDLFFTGWVQHLLTTPDFQHCYPVFSGGDDLFVVGPWDAIIKLAGRVQRDYRAFTCDNPCMTISAAAVIADSHHPIQQAWQEVEHALEQAKNAGRDRLSLLGATLPWHEWAEVEKEWKALRDVVKDEQAPTALLYKLLEYGRMWQAYLGGNRLGLRAQPLLAYSASRTLDPRRQPRLTAWVQELVEVKPQDPRQQFLLGHLELLAQLLILGKGGGQE